MLNRLRQYRFDWKLSLLTAVLLPLLVSLGFWQLAREQEKLALQTAYEARRGELPRSLATLDPEQDLQYVAVRASGTPDNDHVFLLDNRIHAGRPGYEVLVPVRSDTGLLVFVNRGWAPQGASRADLPMPAPLPDPVTLEGSIYVPVGEPFVLGSALMAEGWPRVMQTLDPALMAAQLDTDADTRLFPYTLRLADGEPGVLVRDWPVVSTSPETHRGYAIQWFAMAAALVLLYLYYSTRTT